MLCFSHISPNPSLHTSSRSRPITLKSLHSKTQFNSFNFSSNPVRIDGLYASRLSGLYCLKSSNSNSGSLSAVDDEFDVELGRLLSLLPEEMRRRVSEHPELPDLIEVVMDLGRKPLARFPSGDFVLSDFPIAHEDLQQATSQVGDFAIDNRAGISKTLHRISAIRNRKGGIIGLTCRVGRAISGSAGLLRDLVKDGASLLLIGPPGVGKTTIIREIARMLANDYKKRVMIVDTSNEIGGDGDIPHAGIGNARRMQVPHNDMQHKVLIEAVENHMPQVIVIDEIGTKLEAMAASTIAQRGIQLVATAHGITIENLIMNPSLEMLVGGIQSVTLGDEEASRRRVQKTVLERRGPATFSCAVEIVSKIELRIHRSLEATVDAVLAGRSPYVEIRKKRAQKTEEVLLIDSSIDNSSIEEDENILEDLPNSHSDFDLPPNIRENSYPEKDMMRLYVYGILEATVLQGINQLKMDNTIKLTDNISEASALLALHVRLKKNSGIQSAAKSHGIPVYVTKTSSLEHITKALRALVNDHENDLKGFAPLDEINFAERNDALEEARIAIEQVVIPKEETVELLPRPPQILALQSELIQKYKLPLERIGTKPDVRIRILPFQSRDEDQGLATETVNEEEEFDTDGDMNGSIDHNGSLPLISD